MLLFICICSVEYEWKCTCVCVSPLTVGASVDFYAQTDATFLTPLQWDEPQETDHYPLLQLVAHDTLRVGVPGEGLWTCARTDETIYVSDTDVQWNKTLRDLKQEHLF